MLGLYYKGENFREIPKQTLASEPHIRTTGMPKPSELCTIWKCSHIRVFNLPSHTSNTLKNDI
jgi:hypothetical protein